MSVFYNFLNEELSFGAIADLIAHAIQREAEQSQSIRNAGGGAIVVEVNPARKSPHDPPYPVNATIGAVNNWLGLRYTNDQVTIGRTYSLLPFHGRYVTEDGELVDCESVAHGKIATLKRIRMSNREEYASFAATDLLEGADCGYAKYHGAVVFIVKDEINNTLMEIYVAVSGSPFDEEDEALALEARAVLEETLVKQFGCRLVGAKLPKAPQE